MKEDEFRELFAEQKTKWEARGASVQVRTRDVVPLNPDDIRAYRADHRSPFKSPHFILVAVLVGCITVVLVLLRRQKKGAGGGPGPESPGL